MLGSKEVGSAYANPLKSTSSLPGRLAQWLQSGSAEVWVKFLLALVGLGLAFATALFSTVSRDAGNVWATVILASTSLVLATLGWTGHRAVPGAARRRRAPARILRLRRHPRRHRLRAGHARDRHRRAQHRQQSSLHRGRRHAGGDSGVRSRFRLGAALSRTRCSAARACLCRTPRDGPHRAAQSASSPAVVFGPRPFHAQEEERSRPSNGSGKQPPLLSPSIARQSSSGCVCPIAACAA